MTTIVHRTPGLLDTRSFTIMGMSAKPGTQTPIGQFGTGLKYSIAGLLRSGAKVDIWIGREHWQFELEPTTFRGGEFMTIVAWVRTWGGLRRRKIALPFTTALGPHWVWWMWMRELHSNTLDEGGDTIVCENAIDVRYGEETVLSDAWVGPHSEEIEPAENQTLIVIDHHDYVAAWDARDQVFYPGATGPADAAGQLLEVLPAGPGTLFYRGLRVLDLRLPSVRTWNILETTPLTEDRTMHEFYAKAVLARHIATQETDPEVIRDVIEADEHHWEHELDFPTWIRPTQLFQDIVRDSRRASRHSYGYTMAFAPPAPPDERSFLERRGRDWRLAEDQLLDGRGRVVLNKPESLTDEDWRELCGLIIDALGVERILQPPRPERDMLPADLYAGIRYHKFETHWPDTLEGEKQEVCSMCGAIFDPDVEDDMAYAPCTGPAWMHAAPADPDDTTELVASLLTDSDTDVPF